jgi:nitrogen-specific signal transduction histidine kinase
MRRRFQKLLSRPLKTPIKSGPNLKLITFLYQMEFWRTTGTGMGLSIARDIVRAHDGKLRVQNTPEGGAQFSFTLPAFHEVQLS